MPKKNSNIKIYGNICRSTTTSSPLLPFSLLPRQLQQSINIQGEEARNKNKNKKNEEKNVVHAFSSPTYQFPIIVSVVVSYFLFLIRVHHSYNSASSSISLLGRSRVDKA